MTTEKNSTIFNFPSPHPSPPGGEGRGEGAGFTLIEVLISLTLLTIILGAVYSSFFTVHRAIGRFNDISLKYREARTVLDIMRREIESGFLKNLQSPDPASINKTAFIIEDRDIFGKSASRLHLTAFSFKGSGIGTILYYAEKRDETINLVKAESSLITSQTGRQTKAISGNAQALEIMEGIEGFTVEALYKNQWIKTWDANQIQSLPEIVKLSIEFDDKGSRVKLVEYARPMVGKTL